LASFLVTACANHFYHVEGSAPYSEYVGKKIPLKSKAFLYEDWTMSHKELLDSDSISGYKKDKLIHVPEGTLVIIDKVELNIGFDSIHSYTAYGRIYLEGHDNPRKFQYLWGWYDSINRAPWESLSTPSKRFVGPNGLQYIPVPKMAPNTPLEPSR
jgi:hypothetical protein